MNPLPKTTPKTVAVYVRSLESQLAALRKIEAEYLAVKPPEMPITYRRYEHNVQIGHCWVTISAIPMREHYGGDSFKNRQFAWFWRVSYNLHDPSMEWSEIESRAQDMLNSISYDTLRENHARMEVLRDYQHDMDYFDPPFERVLRDATEVAEIVNREYFA
jgi:hypothetical protein